MSYKPKAQSNTNKTSNGPRVGKNGKPMLFPIPEAGNQAARISLIIDIGTQEREDFVDPKTKETTPQKPCQQVVVFADLVDQVVDYGGDIGEKQYRMLLNRVNKGDIQGINFTAVPPRDAEGNTVDGKIWTFHPQNLLTKIAKAAACEHILGKDEENNMDISQLLGKGLYVDVDVVHNEDKNGKVDDKGNVIVYTNVNFKGASKLPMVKGKPVEIEDLQVEPLILNHDNVTEETLNVIRGRVLEMMKKAPEYQGSVLQKLLNDTVGDDSAKGNTKVAGSSTNTATANSSEPGDDVSFDEELDSDVPF